MRHIQLLNQIFEKHRFLVLTSFCFILIITDPKCLVVQDDCFTEDSYCMCINEKKKKTTSASQKNETSMPKVTTTKPKSICSCG